MSNIFNLSGLFTLLLVINACKSGSKGSTQIETNPPRVSMAKAGVFSADSAFDYTAKQVAFGPRVPGTQASIKCKNWTLAKLKSFGWTTQEQNFKAVLYNGKSIPSTNVIASYRPEATKRILLVAHYDSRPFGDKDPRIKDRPIDGANDGASGVGVLLEVARALSKDSIQLGVDILLVDTEDWGAPNDYTGQNQHPYGGYCLGSEYWSKNLHKAGYTAYYGILLDMVGAANATFRIEDNSQSIAPSVVENVWSTASQLGFASMFLREQGGNITDDHVPIYQNAKIPVIDIIDLRNTPNTFFEHHHTMNDGMNTIDKNTLKAVGQTVLQVLANEAQTAM
ncbi:MAG: M28 family peptidase [Leadbetterella sp.]